MEPETVVAALFRQIAPEKTLTDLLVEHSVARTGRLLADMLDAARSGRIDPAVIDEGVEPILHTVRAGDLQRWLDLVQRHDDTTLRHCLLVAGLVAHFATRLALPMKDRAALVRAGLVHDVGKARIPLAILNKPGPLDAAEMAVMRTHAAVGYDILVESGMDDPVGLAATRHHHEMLDGSGYPDGLHGDAIADPVRLVAICDIYAALIERRPYRPPMTEAEALRILRGMAAKLEHALVEAFAASLASGDIRGCVTDAASAEPDAAAGRSAPETTTRRAWEAMPPPGPVARDVGPVGPPFEPLPALSQKADVMTASIEHPARTARSAEHLRRIADLLDLPVDAFLEPPDERRSLASQASELMTAFCTITAPSARALSDPDARLGRRRTRWGAPLMSRAPCRHRSRRRARRAP